MAVVGQVESLWRYPVKSMRGEQLDEAFMGFAGVYGDRLFAVTGSGRPKGFPWLTGREQNEMLLYTPRFRHPEHAAGPPNLAEAEEMAPGVTPAAADAAALAVDVETPTGAILAVDDPALLQSLDPVRRKREELGLVRSERALTDCRPVSLFSVQTARQVGEELGMTLDKLRFRANIYMDVDSSTGFAEDAFVGQTLQIGSKVRLSVLERDPRCAMIAIDPETAEREPALLKQVTAAHEGFAGVYAAVLVEGTIRAGDEIKLHA